MAMTDRSAERKKKKIYIYIYNTVEPRYKEVGYNKTLL